MALLAMAPAMILAASPVSAAHSERKVVEVDGWGYIVTIKGDKVRVDQRTFWTRDKIQVFDRARRALLQAMPGCTIREHTWNSGILQAYVDCPQGAAS